MKRAFFLPMLFLAIVFTFISAEATPLSKILTPRGVVMTAQPDIALVDARDPQDLSGRSAKLYTLKYSTGEVVEVNCCSGLKYWNDVDAAFSIWIAPQRVIVADVLNDRLIFLSQKSDGRLVPFKTVSNLKIGGLQIYEKSNILAVLENRPSNSGEPTHGKRTNLLKLFDLKTADLKTLDSSQLDGNTLHFSRDYENAENLWIESISEDSKYLKVWKLDLVTLKISSPGDFDQAQHALRSIACRNSRCGMTDAGFVVGPNFYNYGTSGQRPILRRIIYGYLTPNGSLPDQSRVIDLSFALGEKTPEYKLTPIDRDTFNLIWFDRSNGDLIGQLRVDFHAGTAIKNGEFRYPFGNGLKRQSSDGIIYAYDSDKNKLALACAVPREVIKISLPSYGSQVFSRTIRANRSGAYVIDQVFSENNEIYSYSYDLTTKLNCP